MAGLVKLGQTRSNPPAACCRFVNPVYLTPKAWGSIQKKFAEDGSVQLQVRAPGGISVDLMLSFTN